MEATLYISNNYMSLTIPVELNVPQLVIEGHERYIAYNYKWKLAIRHHEGKTLIETVYGSGRGQAARFDEFVGKEIAGLRLSLTRHLRRIDEGMREFLGEQTVSVYVSDEDVERMQRMIDEFKATPDGETATFRYANDGPYREEAVRELIERHERQERDRRDGLTPEQRLLKAIFGEDYVPRSMTD
ncbi:MAG TPA: hypothetical protein PK096_01470 [Candidatus Saccharibacteria bacterium]|nr:hypothetical protein [Candidatus Saccharibacteria bacterium]HRK94016.1 hypothetical protein [Candidatus Saccharibacteria bacterium]